MATLKCSNKILFAEQLNRLDKEKGKEEKTLEVAINIGLAFPKQDNSDFIERKGRFNLKFLINVKDIDNNEDVFKYLSEYSIRYVLSGNDLTEADIVKNNLIKSEYIAEALERAEDSFKLAGLDIPIKNNFKQD